MKSFFPFKSECKTLFPIHVTKCTAKKTACSNALQTKMGFPKCKVLSYKPAFARHKTRFSTRS